MTDAALGAVVLAVAILFVVGLVIALTTREARRAAAAVHPPRGVHLPPPSWLPVLLAVGGALIGAGLAYDATFPWLLIVGLAVLLVGVAGWYRAAGHEWREREVESHDDRAAHH